MANEKLFHVGVKAMIVNDSGKLLLMEEDGSMHKPPMENYWDFPGGRMSKGENTLEALRREMYEETGLIFEDQPEFITAVISNHEIPLSDCLTVGIVIMVYRVKVKPGQAIKLSDEHVGYEWVDLDTAKKRLQKHKYPKEFTDRLSLEA